MSTVTETRTTTTATLSSVKVEDPQIGRIKTAAQPVIQKKEIGIGDAGTGDGGITGYELEGGVIVISFEKLSFDRAGKTLGDVQKNLETLRLRLRELRVKGKQVIINITGWARKLPLSAYDQKYLDGLNKLQDEFPDVLLAVNCFTLKEESILTRVSIGYYLKCAALPELRNLTEEEWEQDDGGKTSTLNGGNFVNLPPVEICGNMADEQLKEGISLGEIRTFWKLYFLSLYKPKTEISISKVRIYFLTGIFAVGAQNAVSPDDKAKSNAWKTGEIIVSAKALERLLINKLQQNEDKLQQAFTNAVKQSGIREFLLREELTPDLAILLLKEAVKDCKTVEQVELKMILRGGVLFDEDKPYIQAILDAIKVQSDVAPTLALARLQAFQLFQARYGIKDFGVVLLKDPVTLYNEDGTSKKKTFKPNVSSGAAVQYLLGIDPRLTPFGRLREHQVNVKDTEGKKPNSF